MLTARKRAITEILGGRLSERRLRSNPHVVKRKMTRYIAKRTEQRRWPQPTRPPNEAVVVLKQTVLPLTLR